MIKAHLRRFPRTLFAQMVVLLAAAVLVAKLGSWFAFMDERAFAVRQMHVLDTIARVGAAVRLLSTTPTNLHQDMLEAASGREFRFWLADSQAVDYQPAIPEAEAARDRLRSLIGPGARDIFVKLSRPDDAAGEASGQAADVALKMSVLLPDGRWLNAATYQTQRLPGLTRPMLLSTLSAVGVLALVSFFISRRIARPLQSLALAAERLGRGEAVKPLDETVGPEEVRRAGAAFNAMGARLRRFVDDRTRMLAAVGHDLRTPITNLRLRVELLEEGETKARMLDTLDELRQTAETMLSFAREEAGEEPRPADIASLVESVCDDMAEVGAPVTCDASSKLVVICRPAALRRAVRNLVENAVAYGGCARVVLSQSGGEVRIVIDDDGPGIPHGEIERVFDPFVRLEDSRNRRTGGVGLGLSIARSIARGHGGDIWLERRPEGGLRAILNLPICKSLP